MTFEQIRIAVESRLAEWPTHGPLPSAPVAFDSVPIGPSVKAAQDAKEPWVRCVIQHGDSRTAGIGSQPCVRRTGLIMCQVFTAERIGSATAAQLADSLAEHLQYWQSGQFSTQAASVRRVGPQDGWFQYNVTTPFRAG
ncbi:phage tail terminator-like protein [Halomonas sp. B23F22_10]|uniref:phage tail terminator-like protein n=1 Tax=Halomonas sp. B23F22_10 TaxID=3459515 RepID=UPI00373E565A